MNQDTSAAYSITSVSPCSDTKQVIAKAFQANASGHPDKYQETAPTQKGCGR